MNNNRTQIIEKMIAIRSQSIYAFVNLTAILGFIRFFDLIFLIV